MNIALSPLQAVKLWLVHHVHLAKDALHIYVALGVLFGSALLFGWRLSSWRPWLIVVAVAIAGEAWDIRDSLTYGTPVKLSSNLHDIWNTLFWPSAILLFARYTRLFDRSYSQSSPGVEPSTDQNASLGWSGEGRVPGSKPIDPTNS